MNFKDLQYSIGKLKSDVQTHLAKNNPMQKQDTKGLSLWIFEERNDLASMKTLSYQKSETNKALKSWIDEDMAGDNTRDLEDVVGDKIFRLLDKQLQVEQEYIRKYQQYRQAIKSIREREDKMSDIREKKRSLQSRISNLTKSSAHSPKLSEFQKELRSLEHDTAESELDLANFKRFALKEAFYLRMNAMHAYAEKTALIAGFGKYLVDLIEVEQKEYTNGPQAAIILADALNALDYWKPSEEDERSTFAYDNSKGKAPLVPKHSEKIPPKLPPRTAPTGYETEEVQQTTSDLKTQSESETDVGGIDLYDAPPPAYVSSESAPLNADRLGSFYSPYQAHAAPHVAANHETDPTSYQGPPNPQTQYQDPLYQHQSQHSQQEFYQQEQTPQQSYQDAHQQPYNPYQESARPVYQSSPYPIHATPYQAHPSPHPAHIQASYSSFADSPYPVDYHQLYRQVSQRQNPHHHGYRPYEEFQQRYKVDAGGFRVPPPITMTAEQEKEQLAKYYAEKTSGEDPNLRNYEEKTSGEEHKPENKD
ncbi:Eisosome component PIL1-domain-containing protein [Sporodiniella umbellata]|nr:Eisosome component PIL1-domain-containing protein [Sporodiniella umbellata]